MNAPIPGSFSNPPYQTYNPPYPMSTQISGVSLNPPYQTYNPPYPVNAPIPGASSNPPYQTYNPPYPINTQISGASSNPPYQTYNPPYPANAPIPGASSNPPWYPVYFPTGSMNAPIPGAPSNPPWYPVYLPKTGAPLYQTNAPILVRSSNSPFPVIVPTAIGRGDFARIDSAQPTLVQISHSLVNTNECCDPIGDPNCVRSPRLWSVASDDEEEAPVAIHNEAMSVYGEMVAKKTKNRNKESGLR